MATEANPTLPPISSVPYLDDSARDEILALLFEPSPTLTSMFTPLLAEQIFPSYNALIGAVCNGLQTISDLAALEDILSSHPRLGAKKVESAMSQMEQKAMEKASGNTSGQTIDETSKLEEQETLKGLNEEYEKTFPGLRYVVFVNGRSRPVIFEDMRRRISRGDIKAERVEAIQAMCDIAYDRAEKLQQHP